MYTVQLMLQDGNPWLWKLEGTLRHSTTLSISSISSANNRELEAAVDIDCQAYVDGTVGTVVLATEFICLAELT